MAVQQEEKIKKLLLIGGVLILGIFLFTMRLAAWKKEIGNLVSKNLTLPSSVEQAKENFNQIWQGGKSTLQNGIEIIQQAENNQSSEQGKLDELKKKIETEIK